MNDIVTRLRIMSFAVAQEAADDIEQFRRDMAEIERIANIPPADDRFESLAIRMGKIWLLSRNQQS